MRDGTDETEHLPDCGLAATVVSISLNGKPKSLADFCGGKNGWQIATQPLNQGKA